MRSPSRSQRAHRDLARPRHAAADVGNAQAAFPVLDDLGADRRDLRVDDRDRRRRRLAVVVVVEARDEQPQALVHLRRRQADAVILDHRLDHVVDQLLDDGLADLGRARWRAPSGAARDGPCARLSESTYPPNYTFRGRDRRWICIPHDESHGYRFCPRCGSPLERRLLKANEPERLVCARVRLRLLSRSEDRRRHDHPHRRPIGSCWSVARSSPDTASGCSRAATSIAARPLPAAAIREAREECGLDVRLDGLVNIYSYAGRAPVIVVYAATAIGGTLCVDDECLETAEFDKSSLPWDESGLPKHARGLARLSGRAPAPGARSSRVFLGKTAIFSAAAYRIVCARPIL